MTEPSLALSPPEILEIHDKLTSLAEVEAANMILRSDLDETRSKLLLLELCLSCVLPIAEKHAEQTNNDIYIRTCAFIRSTLGKEPVRRKPALSVVKNGGA